MRTGVIASAALHLVVMALIIIKIPLWNRDLPDVSVIPVEIITEAEISSVTTPPPRAKPEAPEPEPEPEPAPPPPPVAASTPPPPAATPDDAVPPLEDIKPVPKPEPPKAEPKPRATAKVSPRIKPRAPSQFDTGRIAALLDRSQPEPEPQPEQQPTFDLDRVAESLGRSSIDNQRQLATLRDMLRSQIQQCWSLPAGAKNAETLVVRLRVHLRPDGTLLRPPEIENSGRLTDSDGEFFRIAAEAAQRAIQRCAPFTLPRDLYEDWRESIQIFDPSQMLDVN